MFAYITASTNTDVKNIKFKWTDAKKTFDKMKLIVECNTLLSYPDFNNPCHIHTDAINFQF